MASFPDGRAEARCRATGLRAVAKDRSSQAGQSTRIPSPSHFESPVFHSMCIEISTKDSGSPWGVKWVVKTAWRQLSRNDRYIRLGEYILGPILLHLFPDQSRGIS